MMKLFKKLVLVVTALSMVLSLAAIPASAAVSKTFSWADLTISDTATGEISTTSHVSLLNNDSANSSSVYYQTGDEYLTIQTTSAYSVSGEPGTHAQFNFPTVTTVMKFTAKVSFAGQNAEISIRPYGYRVARGSVGRLKLIHFTDGVAYNGSTQMMTYDTSKTYDLVIRYQVASSTSTQDAKVSVSLSDGTDASSYTGTACEHFSDIGGMAFVVNKPSSDTNALKIYDGMTASTIAGLPDFGSELENVHFDDFTTDDIPTTNADSISKFNNTKIYMSEGNTSEIVDESAGAYDGKSLKFTVSTNGSQQLRPQLSEITPIRFEFKFKADNFGSSAFTFSGANGATIMRVTQAGALYLGSDVDYGINELEAGKWYMVRGYHNPGSTSSTTDDYAYLELCTTEGKVTHKKSRILSGVGTSTKNYLALFCPVSSTYYIDDLYIAEASAITSDTTNFGVTAMAPAYGNDAPVYHEAKLTLSAAADITDFSADNIFICNEGTKMDAAGYSWNSDNTVLSIPVNSTGNYRVCVFGLKDTSGNTIDNPYMEFNVTSPKVVFAGSGNDLTATFKAKSSDIQGKSNAVLVIVGYLNNILVLTPVSSGNAFTSDAVTTLTATLTDGNTLQDVRAYIWEGFGSLAPLLPVANYR